MNDTDYMQIALDLGAQGRGYTSTNPMVGAVVVLKGRVVGQGYHQAMGSPHAEVNALEDAGEQARGATLYVTLEPCNHLGRTPPCTQKIIQAGIQRVVTAMVDPNPDVRGGGNDFLRAQGIQVDCGVLEAQARRLNEAFIKFVQFKRPFVVLKCAATLDGRIATHSGDARWVTGEAARAYVHEMRHAMDAIMVGIGTVHADDPQLTTRMENGQGRDPQRIVLDTHLSISTDARILNQDSKAATYVVCGPQADPEKKRLLINKGTHVLPAPLKDNRIDLNALIDQLGTMGITSLLIEGGAQVAGQSLANKIVDKIVFFYAPKILGSDQGVPICRGQGPDLMKDSTVVHHLQVSQIGDDIMVQGYIAN